MSHPVSASEPVTEASAAGARNFSARNTWVLVALHAGVLVDRADRRRLLWLANSMRTAVLLSLIIAGAMHVVALPMLYGGALILGVAEVIALTSAAAIIPDAVAPARRESANAWVTAAETLCNELAGPSVGGLLVAAGVAIALGSTISAYLLSMIVLAFLVGSFRIVRDGDQPRPSVHQQINEGLRFL
jgi:MFS family permease